MKIIKLVCFSMLVVQCVFGVTAGTKLKGRIDDTFVPIVVKHYIEYNISKSVATKDEVGICVQKIIDDRKYATEKKDLLNHLQSLAKDSSLIKISVLEDFLEKIKSKANYQDNNKKVFNCSDIISSNLIVKSKCDNKTYSDDVRHILRINFGIPSATKSSLGWVTSAASANRSSRVSKDFYKHLNGNLKR